MPRIVTRRRFVAGTVTLALVSPLVPVPSHAQRLAFSRAMRRTLRAASDAIIPADERMPAASAVGTVGYIERVAAADEKLHALLEHGLRAVTAHAPDFATLPFEGQAAALAHIERTESTQPFFAALRDLVYEAYYTHPRIWKLVGYHFRRGRRPTARLEPFDDQRVARVRALPPLYRQVPD